MFFHIHCLPVALYETPFVHKYFPAYSASIKSFWHIYGEYSIKVRTAA